MPLNIRSIAVKIAVLCFFGVGLIGWLCGLSPATCCRRAVMAFVFGCAVGTLAAKAANAVLISAMVRRQMEERKDQTGGGDI